MNQHYRELLDLVGSRICHDLISPIGAISNGVELISMSGDMAGPELSLITESAENANARIRFFRIAFGAAQPGQMIGRGEIAAVLADVWRGSRLVAHWAPEDDQPRHMVKLAFLLMLCLESAMPRGGRLSVNVAGGHWALLGEAEQLRLEPDLWALLGGAEVRPPLRAATVQFGLAALLADDLERPLSIESGPETVRIRF